MPRQVPTTLRAIAAKRNPPGLLLLDVAKGKVLYLNNQARQTLAWGHRGIPTSVADYEALIPRAVRQWYRRTNEGDAHAAPGIIYRSGRRWYLARRMVLEASPSERDRLVGLLLERMNESRLPLSRVGPQYRLTRRELQIVEGIARGLRDKDIGRNLGISFHTVRASLRTVRAKLRVNTRTGIVAKLLAPTVA